jgi:hypothetical protein
LASAVVGRTFRGKRSRPPRVDEMAALGNDLYGIRRQCDVDRGGYPKPVVCIAHRRPSPELARLRERVAQLVYEALVAGVNPNTVLQNCGIAIDQGARLASVPIEAIR